MRVEALVEFCLWEALTIARARDYAPALVLSYRLLNRERVVRAVEVRRAGGRAAKKSSSRSKDEGSRAAAGTTGSLVQNSKVNPLELVKAAQEAIPNADDVNKVRARDGDLRFGERWQR